MKYYYGLFASLIVVAAIASCGGSESSGRTASPPPVGDIITPSLNFNPAAVSVTSSGTAASTLTATDNVGVTTGPTVSCTNGGSFTNNVFTAPSVTADRTSVCTAAARDAAGNSGSATLTATITVNAANGNTVLSGAIVRTMNAAQPMAEALAYDSDGRIIAVGAQADVTSAAGEGARNIDLGGALVLPGFHDLHLHALEAGINEGRCILTEFGTIATYRSEITACAADQTSASWFIGAGVSMPDLLEKDANPKALLDDLISNKPALILDNLGHGAWANSAALAAVGFDTLAGNPQGGIIRTMPGEASGVVYENAQQALRTAALPPTDANKAANLTALKAAMKTLSANGITAVSDAGGYWTRGHHEAWLQAESEDAMSVRAGNAFYVFPELPLAQQVADITALKSGTADSLVRFDQVKIYVDGILSQGTAAMIDPYTNDPEAVETDPRGFEYFMSNDLVDYTAQFDAAGFGVHFHATGDRGVRLALDAVEETQSRNGVSANRHKVTHLFLVDPADRPRFAALGVTADVQMTPTSLAVDTTAFYRTILGARAEQIIPTASLLAAAAPMTISSDWDADELSPLIKIETAVSRTREAVPNIETAVRLMTLDSAKYLGHDDKTGSLEVGKFADIAIIDKDIFTGTTAQIDEAEIFATLLAGEAVFDPDNLFK